MLKVYSAIWCIHCTKTENYLKQKGIEFKSINIEAEPKEVVDKVIEANGGIDWVVPTLEYNGKWRKGKVFNPEVLERDLVKMGVIQG